MNNDWRTVARAIVDGWGHLNVDQMDKLIVALEAALAALPKTAEELARLMMNILPTLEYVTLDQPRPSAKCRWTWGPGAEDVVTGCGKFPPYDEDMGTTYKFCPYCRLPIESVAPDSEADGE